jgi:hypothetical protein
MREVLHWLHALDHVYAEFNRKPAAFVRCVRAVCGRGAARPARSVIDAGSFSVHRAVMGRSRGGLVNGAAGVLVALVALLAAGCALDDRHVQLSPTDVRANQPGADAGSTDPASGTPGPQRGSRLPTSGESGQGTPSAQGEAGGPSAMPLSPSDQVPELGPPGPGQLASAIALLDFGATEVGVASPSQPWTITNSGSTATGSLLLSNSDPAEFLVSDGCSAGLAPGASCTLDVSYTPQQGGEHSAVLQLTDGSATAALSLQGYGAYRLTVSFQGGGSGRVQVPEVGIDCVRDCTALVSAGLISLEAVTQNGSGSFFAGWVGAAQGTARRSRVAVVASLTIGARFLPLDHNLIFVSSAFYAANLGGLAAYDSACNAAASAAGINDAAGNAFIAGMNDSSTQLSTRLGSARGWVRIDGQPVADQQAELFATNPVVRYPVVLTELGEPSRTNAVWTGSPGVQDATACADWTDASPRQVVTGAQYSGPAWFTAFTSDCSQAPLPVYCMGRTRTAALPALASSSGKRIWVTNTPYVPGSMTPDAKCTLERPAGVARGVALVSYVNRAASAVIDPAASYVRPDGQLVGTGAQLLTMSLATGPWVLADGTMNAAATSFIWTGSADPDLSLPGTPQSTCQDWQSSTGTGNAGQFGFADLRAWYFFTGYDCTTSALLYCVEP